MRTMFTQGQKVICINDCFHRSIVEWADHIPRQGQVYTVKHVALALDAVTGEIGPGLLLEELPNPWDKVCFSVWRFDPYCDEAESERAAVEVFGPDWATRHPILWTTKRGRSTHCFAPCDSDGVRHAGTR